MQSNSQKKSEVLGEIKVLIYILWVAIYFSDAKVVRIFARANIHYFSAKKKIKF